MGKIKKQKKRTKRAVSSWVISDLLMLVCILLLIYPITSDIWNSVHNSYMQSAYDDLVQDLDETDDAALWEEAQAYNASLVGRGNERFSMTDEEREAYERLLRIDDTDVMAYLDVPSIGVEHVPVYHGTSDAVLQAGVGHYEGSSLPIGGESTHCVLSGHSGMAGLKMFTALHDIQMGALFQITVLGEVHTYQVDAIHEVDPDDTRYLTIEEGEDYCTLVTCTPIGVNSQRLLVRGHRVPTPTDEDMQASLNEGQTNPLLRFWNRLTSRFAAYELIMAGLAILILLLFIVPDSIRLLKRFRQDRKEPMR